MKATVGDKVRVKTGPRRGERGVVKAIQGATQSILLDSSELIVILHAGKVFENRGVGYWPVRGRSPS